MRHTGIATLLTTTAALLLCTGMFAAGTSGYSLGVLVGGDNRPEYYSRGTVYIEALRGTTYELRITNPTPYRVAVALSVDGLNTIDAKHTAASKASKWVLDPYESTVISGWQVSGSAARRFFFTGERRSYGAALGQTDNLGVIEAVFYQERHPIAYEQPSRGVEDMPMERKDALSGQLAPSAAAREESKSNGLSDDYAATGMGSRTNHHVESVDVDLDPTPVASVRIRYEFRQQLVKMRILEPSQSPIERRERARGFGTYCPQPN
jgi:hypothetical protein